MSRVDRLADRQVGAAIDGLVDNSQALRSATKQTVGARNIISYLNATAAAYDSSVTLPAGTPTSRYVGGATAFFKAQYQVNCGAVLTFQVYVDNMSSEVIINDALYPYVTVIQHSGLPSDNYNRYQWDLTLQNGDSVQHTYYIKYQVIATDTGTVSAG